MLKSKNKKSSRARRNRAERKTGVLAVAEHHWSLRPPHKRYNRRQDYVDPQPDNGEMLTRIDYGSEAELVEKLGLELIPTPAMRGGPLVIEFSNGYLIMARAGTIKYSSKKQPTPELAYAAWKRNAA